MTQNDLKLAVIAINNAYATNNPKGVTNALKGLGYTVNGNFDILSYDVLTKTLLEIYTVNPSQWGEVLKSVPFNYQKTDSSTSQNTKSYLESIIRSYDPNYQISSTTAKGKLPDWAQTALNYILGSTTTTTTGTPTSIKAKISPWVYVAYIVLGLAILGIVYLTFKQKSI